MAVKTKDYYETLGIKRSATADEIKTAYRKLARKFHPDLNPGDKAAEDRFKELQEAYDVLSDAESRKLFDQYGENWRVVKQGGAPPPPGWESGTTARGPQAGGFDFEGYDFGGFRPTKGFDIFEELFRRTGRGRAPESPRGHDIEAELELSLEEAHRGGRRSLQLQAAEICPTCSGSGTTKEGKVCPTCDGAGQILKPKVIEVNIPPGVREGATLRLPGQGGTGRQGAEAGDLYLHLRLKPHRLFLVRGDDVELELSLSPWDAVLGTRVTVPTIDGQVEMTVPPGAQTGQVLRLRGQGLNKRRGGRGDQYVRLKIVVPTQVSSEERGLYEGLRRLSKLEPKVSERKQ